MLPLILKISRRSSQQTSMVRYTLAESGRYSCSPAFGLGSRRGAFMPFLGEGILTQDGGPAHRSRELLRHQFVRAQYQNLEMFSEHVDNLIAGLATTSGIVDLQPFFFSFTLDTTTAFMFGQSVGSLKSDVLETFGTSFTEASLISAMRVRLSDFYWAYSPSRYSRACKTIRSYTDDYVKQALEEIRAHEAKDTPSRYVFIRELYQELKDPALVRDQMVNVLMAGRDSTACLMSWTLYVFCESSPSHFTSTDANRWSLTATFYFAIRLFYSVFAKRSSLF